MERKKEQQTSPSRPKLKLTRRALRTLTDPDLEQIVGGACHRSEWCRKMDFD